MKFYLKHICFVQLQVGFLKIQLVDGNQFMIHINLLIKGVWELFLGVSRFFDWKTLRWCAILSSVEEPCAIPYILQEG